jgi:hypothetical protein
VNDEVALPDPLIAEFDTLADLKALVRNSLRYFQTVRHKVKTLLTGRQRKTRPKCDNRTGFVYQ